MSFPFQHFFQTHFALVKKSTQTDCISTFRLNGWISLEDYTENCVINFRSMFEIWKESSDTCKRYFLYTMCKRSVYCILNTTHAYPGVKHTTSFKRCFDVDRTFWRYNDFVETCKTCWIDFINDIQKPPW